MKLLKVENQAAKETMATMHLFSIVVKTEYFSVVSAFGAPLVLSVPIFRKLLYAGIWSCSAGMGAHVCGGSTIYKVLAQG